MEGLAEWLRDKALEREKNDAHQLFPHGTAILRRWASEVEALRQRPGAQAPRTGGAETAPNREM